MTTVTVEVVGFGTERKKDVRARRAAAGEVRSPARGTRLEHLAFFQILELVDGLAADGRRGSGALIPLAGGLLTPGIKIVTL